MMVDKQPEGARQLAQGRPDGRSNWRVRKFSTSDMDAALRLWETWSDAADCPTLALADMVQALGEGVPAVVAQFGDDLVGAAFARISGQRGWVQRLVIAEPWRNRGIGSALLSALERDLHERGIDRLVAVIPPASAGLFRSQDWRISEHVAVAEKDAAHLGAHDRILRALGATSYPSLMWDDNLSGSRAGQAVQRRLLDPIAYPQLSEALGLRQPTALLLFGPPGTGKSTFVQALAGCLGRSLIEWPQPGVAEARSPEALGALLDAVGELSDVVLFLDEVDEYAVMRGTAPAGVGVSFTNELLKALSRLHAAPGPLLVAATNHIDRLDHAVLRPGRFDMVLPVGPPDSAARRRIVESRLHSSAATERSTEWLVAKTDGYTTADLLHLLDIAAQAAFEDAVMGCPPVIGDKHLRRARHAVPPSLSPDVLDSFARQSEGFSRE